MIPSRMLSVINTLSDSIIAKLLLLLLIILADIDLQG